MTEPMWSIALDLSHYTLTRTTIPPLVLGVAAAVIGALVLLRERGSRVGLSFGAFAAGVSLWLTALGAACSAHSPVLAWWWARLATVGLTFIPTLVYLFTLVVVDRLWEFRPFLWASIAVSALFCAGGLWTNWLITGFSQQAWGNAPQYGPLNALFLAFLFGLMAVSLRLYWVEYRRASPGTQKQRFEGFLLAFCVAYLGSFDYFSLYRAPVYPFGYLPIFVFLVMASRAVTRYSLSAIAQGFAAHQILDTMQGAVLVADLKGVIRVANRAACLLLGYDEAELHGLPFPAITEGPGGPVLSLQALLRGDGTVRDHEMGWRTKRAKRVDVSVSASVLRGRDTAVGVVYVALDITERKRAAEALQAANARMKELAAIKDEFVAKVSHELRTPLTAIKEGISLMLDGALGAVNVEQHEFLAMVDQNIDRLTELISNMLDLSKIEAGRLRLLRRRVAMASLVDMTITSFKALAGQRTVRLEPAQVPHVFADTNRLLQVLGNLLSNAVKFTADTGTVTFRLDQKNGHVFVSVHDDGVGIAEDEVPKLFEKFSQVGPGSSRATGTGLGLALCKELVELHKGRIAVASRPGQGSTFTFSVPVYTTAFALEDSFTELLGSLKPGEPETVGLVALDAGPILPRLAVPPTERLESVADLIRKHVHREDVVLTVEPRWVMLLVVTDAAGVQAIVQRLRGALRERLAEVLGPDAGLSLEFGVALYPADGQDMQGLLVRATGGYDE